MHYTVHEMAKIANVTVKTLHHYHRIGLLAPGQVSQSGYRLYGQGELERLQEILFYRELDFPLKQIKELLEQEGDRTSILTRQRALLQSRRRRLENLITTLDNSIRHAEQQEPMAGAAMFQGFNEAEWRDLLQEQSDYLKERYRVDFSPKPLDASALNEQAREGAHFLQSLAQALRDGWSCTDEQVKHLLSTHLVFLKDHGIPTGPADFLLQARFQVEDDFHRKMMESIQIGLSYYLLAAVEAFTSS
jgi:DNA-binding transcriptional MerR regulator